MHKNLPGIELRLHERKIMKILDLTSSRKSVPGHSTERSVGCYTPTQSHLKIGVLPQCEAFSADFVGRRSFPNLHDTKLTEGERLMLYDRNPPSHDCSPHPGKSKSKTTTQQPHPSQECNGRQASSRGHLSMGRQKKMNIGHSQVN